MPHDPIDSADQADLRAEILRLRDQNIGLESRAEVLAERTADLEARTKELNEANRILGDKNQALEVELGRSPIIRVARAVARRLKLR